MISPAALDIPIVGSFNVLTSPINFFVQETPMIVFQVNDMTCGHCASSITKAVKGTDNDAEVRIDVAKHRVEIDSNSSNAAEMSDAISAAGYTPVAV